MKKDLAYLQARKAHGELIASVTCYDYPSARWADRAGIDLVIVGDSVGTNVLGYANERSVTLADMAHHVAAVHRGLSGAYLLADLPYRTYEDANRAVASAGQLVVAGADGVKIEGPCPDIVRALVAADVHVCGHLGFNPQWHEKPALQARSAAAALQLMDEAVALESAGAGLLVLEMIPEEVGYLVSRRLGIPTIGIGAGRHTDGQVLVLHDVLGIAPQRMRHAECYARIGDAAVEALERYVREVRGGDFPREANVRHIRSADHQSLAQGGHDVTVRPRPTAPEAAP